MNKINPIYILALVFVFFLISTLLLSSQRDDFVFLNKDIHQLNVKGKVFSEYKNNWFNEDIIIQKVNRILQNRSYKNEKILKTQTKNLIRIKFESNNSKLLNNFLNRILNEKFLLKKITIEKSSIYLEIGLK